MIIITIFIVVAIFSFFVIVLGTNAYTQFDKFMERQQERGAVLIEAAAATKVVNMTDNMKYLCIKMDVNGSIDQIKNKEQQTQCEEFLERVSIFELKELIDKYRGAEDK